MSAYHYTECGLNNVFIEGLAPVTDVDGDEVIEIPAINALHCAIAEGIVKHEKGISGDELRFLRSEMGYTQAELATIVHVDKQTIGRWERGEFSIEGTAETVIRRLAVEKLVLPYEEGLEKLARSSVSTAETQPINIKAQNGSYQLQAA
ncbi:MAG TPA: transcriptional regulator [Octadecabacter sp.]|nr:transcriptional regulator [Octadecabacter sp.]